MSPNEVDLSGKKLGHYEIINQLGKGGMAVVYKAHEASLNRFVALKVLSSRLSEDTEYIKRFQREARAAAQLNHPNIVQIYAIGEENGVHYFAMEYIKGMALADLKQNEGFLTPKKAIPIIKQVAEALGEAHKAGLVHRDIKPSNIMLDAMGRAKVTDFGIAFISGGQTRLTQEGSIIGTPEYLSPEQCEGRDLDGRSDIYSLGVTLYELLTGRTPYTADTPVSMLMKIVKGSFMPIAEAKPDVPESLQRIVEKMMHNDREQRYANVYQLIKDLEAVERDEFGVKNMIVNPTEAVPKTRLRTKEEPEPVAIPAASADANAAKKSNKWIPLIVILVVVILVGGAYAAKIFYFDKQQKDTKVTALANNAGTPQDEAQPSSLPPQGNPAYGEAAGEAATPPAPGQENVAVSGEAGANLGDTGEAVSGQPGAPQTDPTGGGMVVPPTTPVPPTTTSTATHGTAVVPTATPQPRVVARPKPQPPANSVVLTTLGDTDKADMITAYIQGIMNDGNFTIIDGPSVENSSLAGIARYHLVTTANHLGSTTLQYYGSTSELYTVGLTMKVIDTQTGRIIAGPMTSTVKYTAINAAENLKEAIEKLATQVKNKL